MVPDGLRGEENIADFCYRLPMMLPWVGFVAVTFMAEIGDVRRFETLVKLMAYLGRCQANTRLERRQGVGA